MSEQKSLVKKATLVQRMFPELNGDGIERIIRLYEKHVKDLGFEGIERVKYVPIGKLLPRDFEEFEGCCEPDRLFEEFGVVFINSHSATVTPCYHLGPDLEVGLTHWILRTHPALVNAFGFKGIADSAMFIPAGPPRDADFKDFGGCVDPVTLFFQYGIMFIDTGYGRGLLDQHRQKDCRYRSSIERLVELSGGCEGLDLMWLMPLVRLVANNDLFGTDTSVTDQNMRSSDTPHVARTLRKLISGLNSILPNQPEQVLQLVHLALNGVARQLPGLIRVLDAKLASDPKVQGMEMVERIALTNAAEELIVKRLFAWERMLAGVQDAFGHEPTYVAYFETMAQKAWKALEAEWLIANRDYWSTTTRVIKDVMVNPEAFKIKGKKDRLTVVCGRSASKSFGSRCRLGNVGKRNRGGELKPRPQTDKPVRVKADVIVQIFSTGPEGTKFLVSTRGGITLEPVAYALRLADLRERYLCIETGDGGRLSVYCGSREAADALVATLKKDGWNVRPAGKSVLIFRPQGMLVSDVARVIQDVSNRTVVVLDAAAREHLASSGNNTVTVRNARWEEREESVLYFADFLSSFGNAHNTNPFAKPSALSPESILSIVLYALRATAPQDKRSQTA